METVEIIESILTDDSKVYDVIVRVQGKKLILCCTDKIHAECMASSLEGIIEDAVHIAIE